MTRITRTLCFALLLTGFASSQFMPYGGGMGPMGPYGGAMAPYGGPMGPYGGPMGPYGSIGASVGYNPYMGPPSYVPPPVGWQWPGEWEWSLLIDVPFQEGPRTG